jgi:hypothetical protein
VTEQDFLPPDEQPMAHWLVFDKIFQCTPSTGTPLFQAMAQNGLSTQSLSLKTLLIPIEFLQPHLQRMAHHEP